MFYFNPPFQKKFSFYTHSSCSSLGRISWKLKQYGKRGVFITHTCISIVLCGRVWKSVCATVFTHPYFFWGHCEHGRLLLTLGLILGKYHQKIKKFYLTKLQLSMEYLKSQRCFNLVRDILGEYILEGACTMFRTEKLNSPHACTAFKASKARAQLWWKHL